MKILLSKQYHRVKYIAMKVHLCLASIILEIHTCVFIHPYKRALQRKTYEISAQQAFTSRYTIFIRRLGLRLNNHNILFIAVCMFFSRPSLSHRSRIWERKVVFAFSARAHKKVFQDLFLRKSMCREKSYSIEFISGIKKIISVISDAYIYLSLCNRKQAT